MSLRSADLRFLVPVPPTSAFVSVGLSDIAHGFQQAGIKAVERRPDLAVVSRQDGGASVSVGARAVIVVGRGGRRLLARREPIPRRFVALPDALQPHIIIPVDRRRVASYAISTWASSESRLRRLRNRIAVAAIAARAFPDLGRSLTLGLADGPTAPFFIAAAERFGVPPEADWFLTLGLGDALTRAAFQLFPPGGREPSWVLKFSRVPGHLDPFDRDERGLRLAAEAGGTVAEHAPRLLGRFAVDGLPASVEQAAAGARMTYLLQTPGRRAEKLRTLNAVAEWIVQLGRETAAAPAALAEERQRLEEEVMPHWRGIGISADLVRRVPDVPAVLQHNDLGCWNLVAGSRGFMAVDWESARRHGLPLWDLLYFLVDALVHLDGAWDERRREAHAARLLRGEEASSAILFSWVREAVESLAIPTSAVGSIATLGWLHHGLSRVTREAAAEALAPGPTSPVTYGEWMARVWLREPKLGVSWSAWEG